MIFHNPFYVGQVLARDFIDIGQQFHSTLPFNSYQSSLKICMMQSNIRNGSTRNNIRAIIAIIQIIISALLAVLCASGESIHMFIGINYLTLYISTGSVLPFTVTFCNFSVSISGSRPFLVVTLTKISVSNCLFRP